MEFLDRIINEIEAIACGKLYRIPGAHGSFTLRILERRDSVDHESYEWYDKDGNVFCEEPEKVSLGEYLKNWKTGLFSVDRNLHVHGGSVMIGGGFNGNLTIKTGTGMYATLTYTESDDHTAMQRQNFSAKASGMLEAYICDMFDGILRERFSK